MIVPAGFMFPSSASVTLVETSTPVAHRVWRRHKYRSSSKVSFVFPPNNFKAVIVGGQAALPALYFVPFFIVSIRHGIIENSQTRGPRYIQHYSSNSTLTFSVQDKALLKNLRFPVYLTITHCSSIPGKPQLLKYFSRSSRTIQTTIDVSERRVTSERIL